MSHFNFNGTHVLAEIFGVDKSLLDDIDFLEDALYKSVSFSNATYEGKLSKKFMPKGVAMIFLLSESHTSIHTYPEYNALFFDAFTCGNNCDPKKILDSLCNILKPTKVKDLVLSRS